MHTEITLDIMDKVTTELGSAFREFEMKVCPAYATRELARETTARLRRRAQKNSTANSGDAARKAKSFNLQTYKFHALGDYVESIRRYGTTDSYNTDVVSSHLV
jgi:hypothetical protein